MNANYSEALEQQVRMQRWICTGGADEWLAAASRGDFVGSPVGFDWKLSLVNKYLLGPLQHGTPYWWSADMLPVVMAMAATLPDWRLDMSLLPSQSGCFWAMSADPTAHTGHTNGPSSGLGGLLWQRRQAADRGGSFLSIVWCPWNSYRNQPVPFPPLLWFEDQPLTDTIEAQLDTFNKLGHDGESDEWVAPIYRRFGAMLLFMNQKIATYSRMPIDRYTRKRLVRDGATQEPFVNVVELRRRERISEDAIRPGEHEWSCQWFVRGHWRQQPYPKAGDVRPRWITPYVKGPENKPLKAPRATVFAVVR